MIIDSVPPSMEADQARYIPDDQRRPERSESEMKTGMRVKARWVDETVGSIKDIACFELAP